MTHDRTEHALRLLSGMWYEGVRPTNVTMRIELKVAVRLRSPRDALEAITQTFSWVREAGAEPPDTRSWNPVSYTHLTLPTKRIV